MQNLQNTGLDKHGIPAQEGAYELQSADGAWIKVEVYQHPVKGLCIFNEQGGVDEDSCHESVRMIGGAIFRLPLEDGDGT